MNIAALFSGGKDSTYALFLAGKEHKIKCLISLRSKNPDSYMFHSVNIHLVELQAKAMGLPLIFVDTEGEKELELKDLEKAMLKAKNDYKIKGVVSGAIESSYQKERVDKICEKLGLDSIAPLWHCDKEQYIKDLIKNRFKIIITAIAADGLDESWLGKEIDDDFLRDIKRLNEKNKISISGEGGEYESLIVNGPTFEKTIHIKKAKKVMLDRYSGRYVIESAELS